MNKMTAVFQDMSTNRLAHIRDSMDKRTGSVCLVTISASSFPAETNFTIAEGPTQDVMFLIGEVAAQGEDALVTAFRTV